MAKPRILYIEDYPVVQQIYVEVLHKYNYEVDVASDGNEALAKATDNDYDLILLDLLLPQMSGLEFLERFRKLDRTGKPPTKVIVLSDFDNPETMEKTKDLQVDDYWIKVENTPYLLVEKIQKLFPETPASS